MALFQAPARPAGHVHVEFKAGRCDWDGRLVTPDKRKGKIVLYTSEEEQLTHFQWIDRTNAQQTPMDLIVINDAYLEKVDKCTTGRVYVLRFTSSNKKLLFWMQEPKEEGDAELIKKFNEAVGAKIPEKGAGGAAPAAAPAAGAAARQAEVDPQLRAFLQQFLDMQGAQGERSPPIPLTAVLTQEVLTELLTDDAAVADLIPHLPESHKSPEGLREVLTSPQLRQSLGALTQAVHSDQLPLLMTSMGLDPGAVAAAATGTDAMEVLCRAMEVQLKEDKGPSPPPEGQGGGAA